MAVSIYGSGQVVVGVKQAIGTAVLSFATGQTWTDITGASLIVTPASSSNRVLVSFVVTGGITSAANCFFRLVRNGTGICIGDPNVSSAQSSAGSLYQGNYTGRDNNYMLQMTNQYLDSPATSGSCTYKLQIFVQSGATVILGREASQASAADSGTAPAFTLTTMEISG